MFTVTGNLPYTVAFGPQTGIFQVLGGPSSNDPNFGDQNVLGSASFTVDVEAPEPSAGFSHGLGLGVLLV